jgi:hydroxyacylglutathione hydrolase
VLSVERLPTGEWRENTFILWRKSGEAVVIDPGEDSALITNYLRDLNLKVSAIINTHGHYDHIGSVAEIQSLTGAEFYLHSADENLLRQANFYKTIFGGQRSISIPKIDVDLATRTFVQLKEFEIKVLHTPGHTEGGCSLLIDGHLFTGDNIISGKVGRSDLPGGNPKKLEESVNRLLELPEQMKVFPGHGRPAVLKNLRMSVCQGRDQQ